MYFYKIVFADGSEAGEYGDSEADVRDFLSRCYSDRPVRQMHRL